MTNSIWPSGNYCLIGHSIQATATSGLSVPYKSLPTRIMETGNNHPTAPVVSLLGLFVLLKSSWFATVSTNNAPTAVTRRMYPAVKSYQRFCRLR